MLAIPSRHKSIFLLTGVVLLQVLLLACRSGATEGRLIRVWTVGAFSPVERAGTWHRALRETWRHYFALQNTSRENEEFAAKTTTQDAGQPAAKQSQRSGSPGMLFNFHKSHENVPMLGAE